MTYGHKYSKRTGSPGHYKYTYDYAQKSWDNSRLKRTNDNNAENRKQLITPNSIFSFTSKMGFKYDKSQSRKANAERRQSDAKVMTELVNNAGERASKTFDKIRKIVDVNKDKHINKVADKVLTLGEKFCSKYFALKSFNVYAKTYKKLNHAPNASLGDVARLNTKTKKK